ncbi:prepilin-type N-terminal cleavage/methylation domain-containing protein [bacterium]|nr:prepilin-type N-terminal cleavage/methylation domain-containing protein [bacterium]
MYQVEDSGFSLIEVVIVMAIMAVMAAIAYPNYTAIQSKARRSAQESNVATIQTALETHRLTMGSYPMTDGVMGAFQALIQSQSLRQIPINPYTGKAYQEGDRTGVLRYQFTNGGYQLTAAE